MLCLLLFGNEKLKSAQNKPILTSIHTDVYIEFLHAYGNLKYYYFIKSLMEWYLELIAIFNGYSKLAGRVSKKHVLDLY